MSQSTWIRLGRSLSPLAARLTQPSPVVLTPEARQQAGLLSSVLLLLILMIAPFLVISSLTAGDNLSPAVSQIVALAILYGLSRTSAYRLAAWITVALFSLVPFLTVIADPINERSLLFLTIAVVLTSVLFSPRWTLLVTAANTLGLLLIVNAMPQVGVGVPNILILMVVLTALVLVIDSVRRGDQQKIEQQARILADSELRYRLMAENATDLIARYTLDGIFLYVSPTCRQLLGYEPEEMIGHSGYEFILPQDLPAAHQAAVALFQNGSIISSYRARRKDGAHIWVESTGKLLLDPQTAAPWEIVTITRDITGRKLMEDALHKSEQRSQALLHALPDLIFVLTHEGVFVEYRANTPESLALPPAQFLGKNIRDVGLPAPFIHQSLTMIDRAIETRALQTYEYSLEISSRTRFFEGRITPLGHASTEVLIVTRDITERKQADEQLRLAHRRLEVSYDSLRRMTQQMPIGIQVFDTQGLCLDVNQAQLDIFGVGSRDQVVGRFNILADAQAERVGTRAGYQRALTGEIAHVSETEFDFALADPRYTATSGHRVLSVSFFPLYDEHEQIVQVVALNEDVTGQRRAEQERLELALQREQVQMLQHLISDTSHDLKTPLATLNTSLYLLKKSITDPERREHYAQVLQSQVTNLVKILDDMDSIARLDRDGEKFVFEALDPNALVGQIVTEHETLASEKNQWLGFVPEAALPLIAADAVKLRRALTNLVSNALNYTPAGGEITVTTRRREETVVIEVRDTGLGIAPQDIPLIFDRFFRSQASQAMVESGSGLGLAIAKKIIQAHDGQIEVESALGLGSLFRVTLPLGDLNNPN